MKLPQVGDSAVHDPPLFREIQLTVLEKDAKNRRLFVKLDSSGMDRPISFWVDPFDFPLVNFSRISRTERLAVMLDTYDDAHGIARLLVLYFPSSRSATKDRPYIDDLIATLLPQPAGVTASPVPGAGDTSSPGK